MLIRKVERIARETDHCKADCVLDMELSYSRRKHNRGVGSRREIMNDDDPIDDDYAAYLLPLQESVKVVHPKQKDDPEYVMFLESLMRPRDYVKRNIPEREDEYFNTRFVPSYKVSNTGKSIETENSSAFVQEDRNTVVRSNGRNVRFCGLSDVKESIKVTRMKRKKSSSSSSGSYLLKERNNKRNLTSYEIIPCLKNTNFDNGMVVSLDEDVLEKRAVDEVIKKRKLLSNTGNHIHEERNLDVSDSRKSGVEAAGFAKIITKPHSFDSFQGNRMGEGNNPISVGFSDSQDKRRTKIKNPFSQNFNYFEEDQNIIVIDDSRSAPENLSFQKSAVKEPNNMYDLFLKNLKVNGDSVVYEFGGRERVYYEFHSDHRLTIVAASSCVPIKTTPHISVSVKSSYRSTLKDVACLPSKAPSGDLRQQHLSSTVKSSYRSTLKEVVSLPSKTPSGDLRQPHLPSTVVVTTEEHPTHPSTLSIPASRPIMPPLDKEPQNNLRVSHRAPAIMRKKLLVLLSQPYSVKEHEDLWKELNHRSAILSHRDSRSGGSCRPGPMGLSLLDHHPDLRSEIDKVESDPHKVLNLLRMLSFYIQKLPYGNICKPWIDDSLMTILLGSG